MPPVNTFNDKSKLSSVEPGFPKAAFYFYQDLLLPAILYSPETDINIIITNGMSLCQ